MLILAAESKTMALPHLLDPGVATSHTPLYEENAADIMLHLRDIPRPQLAAELKLGEAATRQAAEWVYDFPDKRMGLPAIDAFTGVVFKALDAGSLTPEAKERASHGLRLISSLYGWLHPDDIIKPYRLDFGAKLAPGNKALNAYWKKDVTLALIRYLKENDMAEIVNMLPADASRCIDWKLVKHYARVVIPQFKTTDGNSLRTPHAGKLKRLRGEMIRDILEQDIDSADALRDLSGDNYMALGETDYPDYFTYQTD